MRKIRTIGREKFAAAALSMLLALTISGCTQNANSGVAQAGNANQRPPISNRAGFPPIPVNASTPPINTGTSATAGNGRAAAPVKQPTPQIGSGGDDLSLFTQLRSSLGADKELVNTVLIDVKDGKVTLTGSVSSQAQKAKASQLVQKVAGVKSVANNLRVSS